MTAIVDHSRDHDLTVQGSQAARARAIALLAEGHNLPTVSSWSISDTNDFLAGCLLADYDDRDSTKQRAAFTAWAAFLHSPVTERLVNGRVELFAEGRAYGVPIHIWAYLRPALPEVA